MLSNLKKRPARREVARRGTNRDIKLNRAVLENLEGRQLLSTTVAGFSSVVTEIETGGAFATTGTVPAEIVNGGVNATSGPYQFQSFAVLEFDPSNSTVFPGKTITPPTSLTLSLVNNPEAYNSPTGAAGNPATGTFDVYLLPTYASVQPSTAIGTSALIYNPANGAGLPLGLQGQGGLNGTGISASNYFLGSFPAPTANGPFSETLTNIANVVQSMSGTASNASALLTADLSAGTKFELAIVPDSSTSSAEFAGEGVYNNDSANPLNPSNNIPPDGSLIESPQLSYTASAVGESISTPYTAISVNQNNVSGVAEIDVTRSGYAGDSATVLYTTGNGTGVAGTDFGVAGDTSEQTGTVTFAPLQTQAVIQVPIIETNGAPDVNFTVTLSSPSSNATLATAHAATVTVVGTTNEADTIGGAVADGQGNQSFVLASTGQAVEQVAPVATTYAPVNGSVNNGLGYFDTQDFEVYTFNANALQSSLNVTGLSSLTLELDKVDADFPVSDTLYNSYTYSDGTPIATSTVQTTGNFNVYLLGSSYVTSPTNTLSFEGSDANGGGLNGQDGALLLGTASFSDQDTSKGSTSNPLQQNEGIQDTYTFDLSAAAQADLIKDLNNQAPNASVIRLAVTPGSSAFAANFANNNSGTGGNYGVQPYLWFNGTANPAPQQAENFAINYSTISVNANENVVEVDIARLASAFDGDAATVNYSLASGSAVLGTDFSGPLTGTVSFLANQNVATLSIPIIPNSSATMEKSFTVTLTGATTTGLEPAPTVSAAATTVTITPPVVPTTTAQTDYSAAAETSTPPFTGYAYINGGVTNGTGSFAFQGFEILEFQPSQFVQPGQQLTSLTDLSLGLDNYENQQSAPGSNYGGPPGDFTLYLATTPESPATGGAAANALVAYNPNAFDGIGGFTAAGGAVGPLSATQLGGATEANAIPLGVVSFNTKLGLDYFTPTQAALNQQWNVSGNMVSALQLIEQQVNAGLPIRIFAAPGNSAFHAYFFGANTGVTGAGGPGAPQLLVDDTVSTVKTEEAVNFGSSAYNVSSNNGLTTSVSVTVVRSLLTGPSLGDTLTVDYATADGNAINGVNYTAESGTLTFAPGVTSQVITVPIAAVPYPNLSGATAFTLSLTSPATSDTANTTYVTPVVGATPTTTVFITGSANNAETLTQYAAAVGDMGTNGPVTFGTSSLNPAPPFNYSIFTGGKYTALDFNDSSEDNINDPAEFNSPTGPLTPTGPNNGSGFPTYIPPAGEPLGTGPVVFTPAGTISSINEISLNFINYFASSPGMLLNVYLVSDAQSNIQPGVAGTSKNPHFYDTTIHNISTSVGDGLGLGSEVLTLATGVTGGTFTLSYNGQTTSPITYSATLTAVSIASALNTLTNVSSIGGVTVLGATGGKSFTITFIDASQGIAYSTITAANTGLTGTSPSVSLVNSYLYGSTGYLLGSITNPATIFEDGYTSVPMTSFSAAAQAVLISDLNNGTKFRIIVAPETTNTALNADWIYNYTNINPGYSSDTGIPINYYIQPDLSFDVSYASSATPLPSYLTPSANADYTWNPTTGALALTNGSITFAANVAISGDVTDPLVNLTATGPTASVIFNTTEQIAGLTLAGGATASIAPNAGAIVTTPSLTVNPGSTFDITTNKLVINYGSPANDPASTIVPALAAGSHSGWTAPTLITSSSAAQNPSKFDVGYLDGNVAADREAGTVSNNQLEIQFVLAGDAFLENTTVGFDDLVVVAQNFGTTGNDFAEGNFNYDPTGSVGFADLVNVAQNFGASSGVVSAAPSAPSTGSAPLSQAAPVTAVAAAAAAAAPIAGADTGKTAKPVTAVTNLPQTVVADSTSSDTGNGVLGSILGDDTQSSLLE